MNSALNLLRIDHIAIQASNLAQSESWYCDLFGLERRWELTSFADRTKKRLPGIQRLVELAAGDIRLHIFDRSRDETPWSLDERAPQFQHIAVAFASIDELHEVRKRWVELYSSGRYTFALDEQPTAVSSDGDGVSSFYAFDLDGLEIEFVHVADGGGE